MIPKVAKVAPAVNNFHLFLIDGPMWKRIEIPKNNNEIEDVAKSLNIAIKEVEARICKALETCNKLKLFLKRLTVKQNGKCKCIMQLSFQSSYTV